MITASTVFRLAIIQCSHRLCVLSDGRPSSPPSGISIPQKIVGRILSFFFLYLVVFFMFALLLSMSSESLSVAVSMSFACMTGIGHVPTLCQANTFLMLPAALKLLCCLIMSVGRMEIFAFLLLAQAAWNRHEKKW